ncbi:unnamed protein product [Caenorhabditis angaria]|uniref:PPM-type phosphatase domain-containing protein n=1 Tax=Caenorhabditis angaria TaxID=860376 RepID=A0A9P1N7W3_9PELO|nr:unnamed protein product [Caenorhabditis angaria]
MPRKRFTIASFSIFGTPADQEVPPIPVVSAQRSSSSDELRVWRITRSGLVEVAANTMGAFLDKPKTEKSSENGEGNGIKFGVSSMQGWRIGMEDAHITETKMAEHAPFDSWSFFAVFDGHAGSQIAEQASKQIVKNLLATEQFTELTKLMEDANCGGELTPKALELIEHGLVKGFMAFDESSKSDDSVNKSGCTAVCAIVTPSHIIIGNLGDSRAMIAQKQSAVFGTQDHKPYLEKEKKRIEEAGGSVLVQRINGSLAVSRAFGDYDYKNHPLLSAEKQLVSAEPDVYVRERNHESDEFLILACDGIFDVIDNHELAQFVRGRLNVHTNLEQVCDDVLDECLTKGSRDNMTMIVVLFPSAPSIDPVRQAIETQWVEEVKKVIHEIAEETTAAEDYHPEDQVNVKSIADRIEISGKTPIPNGVPTHTIYTLIAQVLTSRQIKHI